MYIPAMYQEEDLSKIMSLIYRYPFAQVVTSTDRYPYITHLPVLGYHDKLGINFLEFHMPKQNPQYQTLLEKQPSTIVFTGPNAYISSGWYDFPEVSTWNYQAVHIHGIAEAMNDEQLLDHLNRLTQQFEQHQIPGYQLNELPYQTVHGQLKRIGGFRLKIDQWEAAFKLSQTLNEESRKKVIAKLYERNDVHDTELAAAMEQNENKKGAI